MKLLISTTCIALLLATTAGATGTTPPTSTVVEAAPANTQTQSQTQQQQQQQAQTTANANNAQQLVDARQYSPRNVASALAPTIVNVAPCSVGGGVGVQGPSFGVSLGGARSDRACERRANAAMLMQLDEREAAIIYLSGGDAAIGDAVRISRERQRVASLTPPVVIVPAVAAPAIGVPAIAGAAIPASATARPYTSLNTPARAVRTGPRRVRRAQPRRVAYVQPRRAAINCGCVQTAARTNPVRAR